VNENSDQRWSLFFIHLLYYILVTFRIGAAIYMRIIDNANTSVEFSAIKVGECLYTDKCLFIRINPVNQKGYEKAANAFCFADNTITYIPEDWSVVPVEADIIIRSKGVKQ
jgi:hypothetical protein